MGHPLSTLPGYIVERTTFGIKDALRGPTKGNVKTNVWKDLIEEFEESLDIDCGTDF
jgi:hypothetical protein